MRTTDNNGGNFQVPNEHCKNLQEIGNCNVETLCENNPNLLVFPYSFNAGYYENSHIFSLYDNKLSTNNLMGFVGKNNSESGIKSQLTISSRFEKVETNDKGEKIHKDYFLHYMLQKVFAINIFKFDLTKEKENIWDFLLYLFPYYLKKAYTQGLFKAYRREQYNDANVKGTIDVARHIRINIPFAGKIAYNTREHSYDNPVTQLIRHTIEYIKTHPFGSGILNCDSDTRDIVSKICFVTNSHYNKNKRQKVISANIKPISHPYFTEYKILQKICLQILRREKITFGQENNKIYGLLFDGAWLWEEYLSVILKKHFIHPENKTGKHRHNLFDNFQPIYPDFISKKIPLQVGDAKYIPLDRQRDYSEDSERATSIYYKTITYMYRFNSDKGFLIFPTANIEYVIEKPYKIKETRGTLQKIGLKIPQNETTFNEFKHKILEQEDIIKRLLISFGQVIFP